MVCIYVSTLNIHVQNWFKLLIKPSVNVNVINLENKNGDSLELSSGPVICYCSCHIISFLCLLNFINLWSSMLTVDYVQKNDILFGRIQC